MTPRQSGATVAHKQPPGFAGATCRGHAPLVPLGQRFYADLGGRSHRKSSETVAGKVPFSRGTLGAKALASRAKDSLVAHLVLAGYQ